AIVRVSPASWVHALNRGLPPRAPQAPTPPRPGGGAGARGPVAARRTARGQAQSARRLQPGDQSTLSADPPPHRPRPPLPARAPATDGGLRRGRAGRVAPTPRLGDGLAGTSLRAGWHARPAPRRPPDPPLAGGPLVPAGGGGLHRRAGRDAHWPGSVAQRPPRAPQQP